MPTSFGKKLVTLWVTKNCQNPVNNALMESTEFPFLRIFYFPSESEEQVHFCRNAYKGVAGWVYFLERE